MGKLAIDNKALSSADTVNDIRQLTDAVKVHALIRGDLLNHAMSSFVVRPGGATGVNQAQAYQFAIS